MSHSQWNTHPSVNGMAVACSITAVLEEGKG